jgi:hypothetical protein
LERAREAHASSRFGRRRSDRFAINTGKDDLRNLLVGDAISNFLVAAVMNERSSCVKQLLNYLLSRSAGRSQGRRKPARFARGALTAHRRGGYQPQF